MKYYSEEFLAERRRINKDRRLRQRRKARKLAKPKGFVYPKLSWEDALDKYSHYLDSLVTVALDTSSSQTEQYHPHKLIRLLSKRILKLVPRFLYLEREDIEQDILCIWWRIFFSYQLNPKTYRNRLGKNLLDATAFRLPFVIRRYGLDTDFLTEHVPHTKDINDLDYLINSSPTYPYNLLSEQDRLLYYYLQRYPDKLTKVSRMLCLSKKALLNRRLNLQNYLKQELDFHVRNSERPLKRRVNVSTSDNQGTN